MNNTILIGREKEQEILKKALTSREAEMVAVIGRRRVGKTFLIESVYEKNITFKLSGIQDAPTDEQLKNFVYQLDKAANNSQASQTPSNWLEVFFMLIKYLETKKGEQRQVVFFDELPWLAANKSAGFLRGLSFFWNSWAVRENVVVVICGSAASWMVQKVVNHTGGLHNRITKRIHLKPFTLYETEHFFKSRNIPLTRYQIVQIYMALGGVPHYLKEVESGKSAVQNINDICFSETGLLKDEFSNLYPALFNNAEHHIAVVRALATKRQGMTREEVIKISKIKNGGTLTKILEELELSNFISVYRSYHKKKKDKLYRLTDEYSLFYLHFIENNAYEGNDTWQHLSQTSAYKSWSGYTFESICIKHLPQIKKALSIAGVYAVSSSFFKKGTSTEKGVQIDLLLDRKDQVINLFEIKFYQQEFVMTKAYADTLKQKALVFQQTTKTKKLLLWIFISPYGLKHNQHSLDLVYNLLDLTALFEH